jgi:hypothetical protein
MAQLGLIVKTAANTIRPGLFWDGSATIVSGKANMSYDVRAFTAVLSRGATSGAVLLSNDAVYNVSQDVDGVALTAPGSNSRYDVVFVWQREFAIDGTDSDPVIGVIRGTAAASPAVPSLDDFPGAIELARILVPAGVTATNSGTTITQTAPFTATAGGVVPFRTTTERDADPYIEGQLGWLIDTGRLQSYSGVGWSDTSPVQVIAAGTLAAASSFNVDGMTGFREYELVLDLPTASTPNAIVAVLRASGSADPSPSGNYDRQRMSGVASTSDASASLAQASWNPIHSQNRSDKLITLRITDLNQTRRTIITAKTTSFDATSNPTGEEFYMRHRAATAFTGIGFTVSSGTVTGDWTLRGIR